MVSKMTKKTLNVIISIMVAFFVLFFAGSLAYETYSRNKSDRDSQTQWEQEQAKREEENSSGPTLDESKDK